MVKYLSLLVCFLVCFTVKAQILPSETDSLKNRAIIVLPSVTLSQLDDLKTEFAKYSQIQKAVFIYGNHNCLLIDLANVANPSFISYSDLIKIMCLTVSHNQIFIKDWKAYDEIYKRSFDDTSFSVK